MSKALMFNFSLVKKVFWQLLMLYLVVGVFIGVCVKNANVAIGVISVVGPFLIMYTLFSYDAKNKWDRYCMALPFGRKDYALGRCLCIALFSVVSAAVAALLGVVFVYVVPLMPFAEEFVVPETVDEAVWVAVMVSAVILFSAACSLPFLFKFGLNKAMRFVPAAMLFLFVFLVGAIPALADCFSLDVNWSASMDQLGLLVAAVALASVVLFALSALVSARIFAQREL